MTDTPEPPKRFSVDNYAFPDAPRLGVRGWLRWGWRQVTSMRLALILLVLLGVGAIPGSVLPQWPTNPADARAFIDANPFWGPLLDRLGFLDVFGSAWFTAIYILLFASLVGCIVPRAVAHGRAARRPVAAAPRRLARYDTRVEEASGLSLEAARDAVLAWARGPVPGMGYRTRIDARGDTLALSLEKGHVREWGNLLFHLSLVGLLIAVAYGSLNMHRGQAIIVEGDTFTNAVVAYDSFESGSLFDPASLSPFRLRLNSFASAFDAEGRPADFEATVTLTEDGAAPRAATIRVNEPLEVDGGKIYLQGNGFAPVITVRDADGNVAFSQAVPFLPQDAAYTSTGVIKVPDVTSGEQLGFRATLYPTAVATPFAGVQSISPQPDNPVILLTAYTGDLGLDDGVPQNVYQLDESQLSPVRGDDGMPLLVDLAPGQTITLPDGLGTVTFEELPRFVALDLRADPSLPYLLAASIGTLLGISVSLFGARRRVWVHLSPHQDGRTLVEAAVLAPPHDEASGRDLSHAVAAAQGRQEDP